VTRRAGFAIVAAAVIAAAATPSYHVTVTGEEGGRLWTVAIRPGTTITLAYNNSIYRAATEEVLTATPTGFALREVRSTSEAVLAYNGLDAPYARDGVWYAAAASRMLPALAVRIGRAGRQHLIVAGRVVPLYEAGEGARVRVEVERAPRAVAALRAWALR
jgi:hypothetical protein